MVKVAQGYKKTEVGVIPEDWEVKELDSIAKIQRGASPRPIDSPIWFDESSNIGWLRISDVSNSSKYLFSTTQHLSQLGITKSRFVPSNNLVMSICATIGRPIITRIDVCIHDGFVVFNNLTVDAGYLYYTLSDIESDWYKHGQTGSQMNLNTSIIKANKIPLPPTKTEQESIAGALSDVDSLLDNLEKLIEKKRNIKQGAMQVLLTGKVRLNGCGAGKVYKQTEVGVIPEDWAVVGFGEIAKIKNERKNPKTSGLDDWCIELEHIDSASGLLNGSTYTTVNSSIKNVFDENDILFGKLRSYLRKYWFATRDGLCSTEIWVIQPQENKTCHKFLYYIVQTESFIAAASEAYGTHMPRADWNVIKELPIPLPPTKSEQESIAGALSDMDAEIESLEQKRAKYRQIKQGMMQELLTGKTRLR
ncbi:MAG: restriction endonuclease subunit S [Sedimentisphaerales bacterium]|nr:restriction endonuclease subunit S [Sedimentisphaerales bacterium]